MTPIPWIAIAVVADFSSPIALPDFRRSSPADPVEAIVANDNRVSAGQLAHGILTLRLEVRPGIFRPEGADGPGVAILAFAEAGRPLQIPGPLLRVPRGTDIRVTVRNPFKDSTLTVYGLGSRPLTSDTGVGIPGGAIREIRFRANTPGTYFYWASTSGEKPSWSETQLAGALVVDSPHAPAEDRIFVITGFLREADSSLAVPRPEQAMLAVNGLSWPHTERLTYTQGDSVRWRWINTTRVAHPMHLHGFYFHLESRGDWRSEQVYRGDERPFLVTNLMLPRETMRVGWLPARRGNWIFHCHFAFHVSHHLKLHDDPGATATGPTAAKLASTASRPGSGRSSAGHHEMAGLVMGITILPGKAPERAAPSRSDARNLRLLVQSQPKRFGRLAGLGFIVQEGATEPSRDSILVPGPTLVLQRGQPARITVVNHLAEPTAVHWHGIELQSFPDGVPGWSGSPGRIMPPIAPGDSFVAEFVPPRAGTFIYHAHHNEQFQLGAGLYGALLVVDDAHPFDPEIDRIVLVGGGGPADSLPQFGFESPGLVNGSDDPPPMDLVAGKTYRIRFININPDWRVIFSLLSDSALATWRPVARDGADLPPVQRRPRPAWLLTGPGQTADFEFTPSRPGELRLEAKTQMAGWIIPIVVRVR